MYVTILSNLTASGWTVEAKWTGASAMLEVLGLDTVAEDVYRTMLSSSAHSVSELCALLGLTEGQVRDALDRLFGLALVRHSADRDGAWSTVDPRSGLQELLDRENAELEQRRARIAASQAALTALIAESSTAEEAEAGAGFERLMGVDAVIARLEQLTETAGEEIAGITPGVSHSQATLDAARRNDARVLERGVRIREVVQDACRNDPQTCAHTRWLAEAGGEVRTAPTLPHRMIVIDSRIGVVPLDPRDSAKGALLITDPGVVGTLYALFERIWDAAIPFGARVVADTNGLTARERQILKLLADGMTDEAVAARLSLSDRTVRRTMNELCERLGAKSRFEAGFRAAQAGWLDPVAAA
jgi:DNA-binding CsgD family transcriptional regulator/sugar-specific transcriptional regulator TrmB